MKRSTYAIFVLATAAALAACDMVPTEPVPMHRTASAGQPSGAGPELVVTSPAPASRSTEEWVTNLSGDYWRFVCEDVPQGELIRMEGTIEHRLTLLDDAAGGFHVQYRSRPKGLRGIGVESGEVYRASAREHHTYNETLMGSTETFREVRRLTGTESGREFRMVFTGQFTVNANGELVVHMLDARFECSM